MNDKCLGILTLQLCYILTCDIFGFLLMILIFKIPVIVKELNSILREPVIFNSNQWKRTEVLIAGNVGIR